MSNLRGFTRLTENALQLTTNTRKNIIEHFENLEKSLSQYFLDTHNDIDRIQNPFMNRKKPFILSVLKHKHLFVIKSMSSLKHKFESGSLNEFWIRLKDVEIPISSWKIYSNFPIVCKNLLLWGWLFLLCLH